MPLLHPGDESAENAPWSRFLRHHHARPYAALVIRGSCDESGDRGRFQARAGDVLVHNAFDAHGDAIGRHGASFINFALDAPLGGWFGCVGDVDAIVRLYERDPNEAAQCFRDQFQPVEQAEADWPDMLARDLAMDERPILEQWADVHGLHPASLSRGFRQAYGVAPKRFRLERLASRAARRIRDTRDPLGEVAIACGFADQAHMTRALRSLFGVTPAQLRARLSPFNTDAVPSA